MNIGEKRNRLTYVGGKERVPYGNKGQACTKGYFVCDCGNKIFSGISMVKTGKTKSCGCLIHDVLIVRNTIHNLTRHKLYNVRLSMINRCHRNNVKCYKSYGGRGIKVCDEWRYDFESFYNWAIKNGWKDGFQIDRINNDGDYCPENCRFVTLAENLSVGRQRMKNTNKSGYNGVCAGNKKWVSYITKDNKIYRLGTFEKLEDAVVARIKKEIELFGEQLTNFHFTGEIK